MSDASSTASLDELVAINIAGDIEAVADDLEQAAAGWVVSIRDHKASEVQGQVERLRRIAAGIRGLA